VVSHAIVDQLRPLLPKDDEGDAGKVKHLNALLEAAMLTDPVFVKEAESVFVKEAESEVRKPTIAGISNPKVQEKTRLVAHLPLGAA
jgi:hypothetical protein